MRSCAAFRPSSAAWRVRVASLTFSSSWRRSWLSRRYPLTVRRLRCLRGAALAPPRIASYDEVALLNGLARDYHVRFTRGEGSAAILLGLQLCLCGSLF